MKIAASAAVVLAAVTACSSNPSPVNEAGTLSGPDLNSLAVYAMPPQTSGSPQGAQTATAFATTWAKALKAIPEAGKAPGPAGHGPAFVLWLSGRFPDAFGAASSAPATYEWVIVSPADVGCLATQSGPAPSGPIDAKIGYTTVAPDLSALGSGTAIPLNNTLPSGTGFAQCKA